MEHFYTEAQIAVRDMVRRFAETSVQGEAAAIDRDDRFPHDIYRAMAELGLYGAAVPEAAGGSGFDTIALALAMEELARCSGSVGNILAVPVEAVRFLHDHGDAGCKVLIADVVSGKRIPATCVSEPDAGSDVAGIRPPRSRMATSYVINGTKAWVSLGQCCRPDLRVRQDRRDAGHLAHQLPTWSTVKPRA